jgi:hypothetical protein
MKTITLQLSESIRIAVENIGDNLFQITIEQFDVDLKKWYRSYGQRMILTLPELLEFVRGMSRIEKLLLLA